jgi:hypothetical protein
MHEHDLDLIAALADGSLDDESQARLLVETCAVCGSEYRSQTEVLAWLAAAPAVEMTELEKAALHRDLWTELRSQPSRAGATPWWQTWSYVAAGLFVLVGLVAVLNGPLRSGGEAADTLAVGSDLDAPAVEEAAPFVGDDSGAGEDSQAGATTTAAAQRALDLPFAELADEARDAREAESNMGTMSLDGEGEDCLDRLGLEDQVVVDELELDQTYLVVMAEDPELDRSVTFVALTECEIVYVDR